MKIWKFLAPLALCLVLVLVLLPTTANAVTGGACGDDLTWTLDDAGTLTISGTGPMKEYASVSSVPWYSDADSVKAVVIEDGVTTISDYAFRWCGSSLKSVTIGNSVTTIGDCVFPASNRMTGIWVDADNPCYSNDSDGVLFNKNKTTLIQAPGVLVDYRIPDGVTGFADYAFYNCVSLTNITIPDSVTFIDGHAFYSCDSLKSVTIPNSVTGIGVSAFEYCHGLTSVTMGSRVTIISDSAFRGCDSLKSVTIPNSVTIIGDDAFLRCYELTDVWYTGNYADWQKISISSSGTSCLTSAIWHFNACPVGAEHTYDNACDTDCNVCGKTRTITHNYQWVIDQQENCGVDGIKHEECTVCHAKRSEGTVIPATGKHIYDNTCDTQCNVCKQIRTIEHTYDNACDTECNVCKQTRTIEHTYDNACDTDCNVCGQTRTITHNYQWVIDQQENCGVDGGKHEECTVCHGKRNEGTVIPATGKHTYDNACDTQCNVCKQTRTIEHTYDNACDTDCNVCGQTRTTTHNYQWVIDQQENCGVDGIKHEECTLCHGKRSEGTKIPATGKHTYDNACDTQCDVCKQIRTIEHTYDNACDAICNVCGFSRTVPAHSYTRNGNHTCDICKYSKTPAAPIVESKTNSSVTLANTEGFEYSKDGTTWQNSNIFTNLSPNTTYTFYQRVKASSVALVSEVSEGVPVTFKSAQSAPPAPIISSFTDTVVTLVPVVNVEYSADGTTWQTSNVFADLAPGTEYTFYQRCPETETHEASNKSAGTTITTDKSDQLQIPDAPTVQSVTASSITLAAVDGCEYSLNGKIWQESNVFTDLSCATEYTFYQRYAQTATTYAGKSSAALVAKTDKGTPNRPAAPTPASKTHNSVTLVAVSGCEYSRDGINWQQSNVFTGLDPKTNYMFYQRYAETTTHYASEASDALIVKTNEEPTYIPGDMDGDETLTTDDAVYLLMSVMFGEEDYPVPDGMSLDFDGSGAVDSDDAVYLLMHVMFGDEDYPLTA